MTWLHADRIKSWKRAGERRVEMKGIRRVLARGLGGAQRALGPEAAYTAGRRYQQRQQYQDAVDAYTQAHLQWQNTGLEAGRSVNALAQGAICKLKLGDLRGGADDLREALRLQAANPRATHMPREEDLKKQLEWVTSRG